MDIEMKQPAIKQDSFAVLEMHCAACANRVEKIVSRLEGVEKASVNFASAQLTVAYDADQQTPESLQAAVRKGGFDLVLSPPETVKDDDAQQSTIQKERQKQLGLIWAFTLVVFGWAMFAMHHRYTEEIQLLLTLPVMAYGGRSFYIGAWKQARRGYSNMDTLVALSTSIAFLFSLFTTCYPAFWVQRGLEAHVYYEAVCMIIAFVSTGKYLEERAKWNTHTAIRHLISLQPQTAHIVSPVDGREMETLVAEIRQDDIVSVHPGERIPVDGTLVEGNSYVDESMISGEPIPVEKERGSKVWAGTINQQGSFRMQATEVGEATRLAHIIRLVQEAQGSKAPIQRIVDRVTAVFVPVVLVVSLLTLGLWVMLGGVEHFSHGLVSALSVLVIACPCALGLATPTALMVGIGRAAQQGILIKDAVALEQLRRVDTIVLDKTGTLTEGKPSVVKASWVATATHTDKEVLWAVESRSEHPLATAISRHLAADASLSAISLDSFDNLIGQGVRAAYQGIGYWVGSHRMFERLDVEVPSSLATVWEDAIGSGHTPVYFGRENALLAIIEIDDPIKPTSAAAIEQLQERGISVYMLTGDTQQAAERVAHRVHIREVWAQALPEDKHRLVCQLQQEQRQVAMVGDGINDSQALAAAQVSIAMGKGTDVAMDVSMVTLISSDLMLLPQALDLSRQTTRLIHQNLFWAFIYNVVGIPVAAGLLYPAYGILMNPMIAGAAMAFSSVSVILNALRLAYKK